MPGPTFPSLSEVNVSPGGRPLPSDATFTSLREGNVASRTKALADPHVHPGPAILGRCWAKDLTEKQALEQGGERYPASAADEPTPADSTWAGTEAVLLLPTGRELMTHPTPRRGLRRTVGGPRRAALTSTLVVAQALAACDAATPLATDSEPPPTTLAFAATRLPVCHLTSSATNEYVPIEVAEPAFDVHIDHGDVGIGGPVPGMEGHVFDDACQPVVAAACPCFDEADLESFVLTSNPLLGDSDNDGRRDVVLGFFGGGEAEIAAVSELSGEHGCWIRRVVGGQVLLERSIDDISRAEAQACAAVILEEGADRGLTCEGEYCGQPFPGSPP
jgi:hypothetical protein